MSEKEQFDKLCKYIKKNILRYGDDRKFPKYLVLRLKGLNKGQFIANKNQNVNASYGYDVILMTFMYSAHEINSYLDKNKDKINGERHLINFIMSVVEKNINDVDKRLKEREFASERLVGLDNAQITASKGNYKRKTEDRRYRRDIK